MDIVILPYFHPFPPPAGSQQTHATRHLAFRMAHILPNKPYKYLTKTLQFCKVSKRGFLAVKNGAPAQAQLRRPRRTAMVLPERKTRVSDARVKREEIFRRLRAQPIFLFVIIRPYSTSAIRQGREAEQREEADGSTASQERRNHPTLHAATCTRKATSLIALLEFAFIHAAQRRQPPYFFLCQMPFIMQARNRPPHLRIGILKHAAKHP